MAHAILKRENQANLYKQGQVYMMRGQVSPMMKFLVFYVDEFSRVIGCKNDAGFSILSDYGIIDYLEEFYDLLHTQGRLYVLTEIVEMLIERGYFPEGSQPFDIIPDYKDI